MLERMLDALFGTGYAVLQILLVTWLVTTAPATALLAHDLMFPSILFPPSIGEWWYQLGLFVVVVLCQVAIAAGIIAQILGYYQLLCERWPILSPHNLWRIHVQK